MIILQILAIGLLGRLYGSDILKPYIRNGYKKPICCLLSGIVFLPNLQLALVVFAGLWIGHMLRDSIFELLKDKPFDKKAALNMTIRAASFLPLGAGVYYLMHGVTLNPFITLLLLPMLSRAPIQYACKFLPLPESGPQFLLTKAAVYELLWCLVIGVEIWLIMEGATHGQVEWARA
jgi:hypothetical protein